MTPMVNIKRAPESPRFYSVAEAARIFGTSEMTLYRAIRDGQFPAVRIRGRYIVPAKAIDSMVDAAMQVGLVDTSDWVNDEDRADALR